MKKSESPAVIPVQRGIQISFNCLDPGSRAHKPSLQFIIFSVYRLWCLATNNAGFIRTFGILILLSVLSVSSVAGAGEALPGKWEIRALMPSARTEVAAVELGGKIYVMGGYGKNGDLVEEYDPAKNSWRGRASLPRPLHHIGAAAVGGKIYVIGGYSSGQGSIDTVYEYDASA